MKLSKMLGNEPQTYLSTFLLYKNKDDLIFQTLPFQSIDHEAKFLRDLTKEHIHHENIYGGGVYYLDRDLLVFSGESPQFGPVDARTLKPYAELVKGYLEKKYPIAGIDLTDIVDRKVKDPRKWNLILGNI